MAVHIQLDRPRRLKFGFNALKHCKHALGVASPEQLAELLQSGDITVIIDILEGCLVGDFEGLNSIKFAELLDDYIENQGIESLAKLMTEVIEDSAFFKAGKQAEKKRKAKAKGK